MVKIKRTSVETQVMWLVVSIALVLAVVCSWIIYVSPKRSPILSIFESKSPGVSMDLPPTVFVTKNDVRNNDINNIYKPPLQDNLDRFLGIDLSSGSDQSPSSLSYMRKLSGEQYGYGLDQARVAATLIPTRVRPPVDSHYKQVGILSQKGEYDNVNILPLMGQYLNDGKWRYYTMSSGNLQTKLPIKLKNKSCTSEYGCNELSSDNIVNVAGFDSDYKTTLYENGTFW